MPDSWGPFTQAQPCDRAGVSFAESPCADAERCRAGPVLWKAARILVLQIHAGGCREGHVRVLQVTIKPVFLYALRFI